jgi:predicted nucleotidyltransferase
MNPLERSLRQVVEDFRALDRAFALVGGLAVSSRAEPRLTRDVDLAVAVMDDDDAEALLRDLLARRYQVVALVEQESVGRLATARLVRSGEEHGLVTDLLFASSGIETEIVAAAEELLVLPDLTQSVATVGHLLAMKLLARDDRHRPADADDLAALAAIADEADWDQARAAVMLIVERGYHRGRDLPVALERLRGHGAF